MKIQTKCKILKWVVSAPYIPFFIRIKFNDSFEKSVNQLAKLSSGASADYIEYVKTKYKNLGEKAVLAAPYQSDRIVFANDEHNNKITILEDTGQTIVLEVKNDTKSNN